MTRQNYTQYQEGDRVLVSDGQKRPPDRFNRKLAAWKDKNYTGHVKTVNEADDYEPYGSLVLKRDDYPDKSWITFDFHVPLGGYLTIDKLKEAA